VSERPSRRRIALVLEYDGTDFNGSQVQANAPTIQQALETAIEQLTGVRPRVAFAGRTDAGVHARSQVSAFDTTSSLDTSVFVSGLNAHLPDQIAIRNAREVGADFDPRRHAVSRTYRYTIYNHAARTPLDRYRAWHVRAPLNTALMQEAASPLVGEHDFASFTRDEGIPTVRCVHRCDVSSEPPNIFVEMEANAFLRSQVRRTVGALVQVGTGKLPVDGFLKLLDVPKLASAGPLAPPQGLCLEGIVYPGLDLTDANTL
jgi:tRNA pseudouridine38-40 synthase